jgi:hypothetical protein
MEGKTITLWRSTGKIGSSLPKKFYEQIKALILSEVLEKDEVTLTHLMNEANLRFRDEMGIRLNWYFLEVKKDLQTHNLIKISFMPQHIQIIKIKSDAKRKVREWLRS